jgi:hypothetical protein
VQQLRRERRRPRTARCSCGARRARATTIQGGFHAAADAGNTVAITNAKWNGPADANGIAELVVFKA